jgi:hypothetical protein
MISPSSSCLAAVCVCRLCRAISLKRTRASASAGASCLDLQHQQCLLFFRDLLRKRLYISLTSGRHINGDEAAVFGAAYLVASEMKLAVATALAFTASAVEGQHKVRTSLLFSLSLFLSFSLSLFLSFSLSLFLSFSLSLFLSLSLLKTTFITLSQSTGGSLGADLLRAYGQTIAALDEHEAARLAAQANEDL